MLDLETSVSSKERSRSDAGSILSFDEGLIGPNEPIGGASQGPFGRDHRRGEQSPDSGHGRDSARATPLGTAA
jgi:hypothetical protein